MKQAKSRRAAVPCKRSCACCREAAGSAAGRVQRRQRAHPTAPGGPGEVRGRAVIVYEPEPRQSRWFLILAAVLVALTTGVVLGQAVAYQPASRAGSTAATGPVPAYGTPPEAFPSPSVPAAPVVGPPLTAPLGSARTRLIEVTGASALLRIRSADLGPLLFSVTAMDGGAMPGVVDTPRATATDSGCQRRCHGPRRGPTQREGEVDHPAHR